MHRRGISSVFDRLRPLPKRSISDAISDDQADPMFEVDKSENVAKREQLQKIMRCMKVSPNSSYLRCVWEHL